MAKKKKKKISKKQSQKITKSASKPSFLQRAKANYQKKKLIYAYCFGFIVLVGISAWIQNTEWFKNAIIPILNVYASISSGILNIFGQGTSAVDQSVAGTNFSVSIKQGCDAIAPMVLYTTAILIYPISSKVKWQGIFGGLLALVVLNIVRIVSLYLSGAYGSQGFFDFMHIEFWQVLYIILTVLVWLVWIRWANNKVQT